jgi:hypothetical protein
VHSYQKQDLNEQTIPECSRKWCLVKSPLQPSRQLFLRELPKPESERVAGNMCFQCVVKVIIFIAWQLNRLEILVLI